MTTWTVFLDRDGTINRKCAADDYVTRPSELHLLPGSAAAVRRLNSAATRVVLVTNQRGISLGRMDEADYSRVLATLHARLKNKGAHLDAAYHCPHDLHQCECRKPDVGMFLQARRDHPETDFRRSVMIGDTMSDIEAANRLGMRGLLVGMTGHSTSNSFVSLHAAVEWVMAKLVCNPAADVSDVHSAIR